jgi:hypothetical protein
MTGKDPLRLGVVGTGAIALRGLLPHLTQDDVQDRVRVAAVCDPVPGRADAVAERFGVPQAFADLESLLAAGGVDAVSIASPIGLHHAQARLALDPELESVPGQRCLLREPVLGHRPGQVSVGKHAVIELITNGFPVVQRHD